MVIYPHKVSKKRSTPQAMAPAIQECKKSSAWTTARRDSSAPIPGLAKRWVGLGCHTVDGPAKSESPVDRWTKSHYFVWVEKPSGWWCRISQPSTVCIYTLRSDIYWKKQCPYLKVQMLLMSITMVIRNNRPTVGLRGPHKHPKIVDLVHCTKLAIWGCKCFPRVN